MPEAFAADRKEYGDPAPPLPSEQVPQNQLRMAGAISAMEEERHRLDIAIRLAQIRLLEEARPEWNASKVIEAAEWADRSRGKLREIAAGAESLLECGNATLDELRRMLGAVADRINALAP
jgi:hypothetical protein